MNVTETLEEVAYFTGIDYAVFAVLLSGSLAVGIYFGFFSDELKTAEDYLVGGHQMRTIPIAISLVSSQLSAISIMTIPVEIYSYGWQYMLLLPTLLFIAVATNYLFLPVFYQNNIENCYVYLELRFGKWIRKLTTIMFIVMNLFFLPVIMYIPSLAFAEVTKHDIQVINITVCYICVVYTMLGGIKSVVWTDVLQAVVMVGSVVLVAFLGVSEVGGVSKVWDRAVEGGRIFPPIMTTDVTTRITFWNSIFSAFFMWTCHIAFSQNCVQRLISLPSLSNAKRSIWYFLVGVLVIMGFNCVTGIIMYAYYHNCDPVAAQIVTKYDKLMPRFVKDIAGQITGMPGIFISCVFSASLSTVSAALHCISGVIYSDYIIPLKLFKHNDVNANRAMRLTIFLLGSYMAFSGLLVKYFSSLFQAVNTVAGITTGAKFGTFTLAMLYPWANQKGVICGILISMAVVLTIITNAQYNTAIGNLHYEVIPTSTSGCANTTISSFVLLEPPVAKMNDDFTFYKISFQWYSTIGVLCMWIPAIIISHLTGGQNFENFNVQLLSPVVRGLVPKKYRLTELKQRKAPNLSQKYENGEAEEKKSLETTELIK